MNKKILSPKKLNVIKELITISKLIYERGYTTGNSGNISARISSDFIVIKKTGRSFFNLVPKDFMITSLYEEKPSNASTDYFIHRKLYLLDDNIKYVIHAHPANIVALSQLDNKVRPVTFEGRIYFGESIHIYDGNHENLVEILDRYIKKSFVIEKGHGIYLFGDNILKLFILLEELDYTASIILNSRRQL